ncbi:crossover junction endonuclease EME1 [Protopterus annectens]|uniref:crossover junction endonuclease EME1 n=1 Tax=Protopterus annectens TaxID=7888 RepID=UPI001CFB83FB|nr:crossover junction endonuclease EME1 [Protopterus annectens]
MGEQEVNLLSSSTDSISDTEALPDFFSQQVKSAFQGLNSSQSVSEVIAVVSSDSGNSEPGSPLQSLKSMPDRGDQSFLNQDIAMASSDSDDGIVPVLSLSERLKDKLGADHSIKVGQSVQKGTKQNRDCDLQALCESNRLVSDQINQTQPHEALVRESVRKAVPTPFWDLSDSDNEDKVCHINRPGFSSATIRFDAQSGYLGSTVITASFPNKKTKRSEEEILKSKQEALVRRADRERLRAQKENHRRQQEQEKEAKRLFATSLKALRPEECMKYIRVAIDPLLLQGEGGGQLLSALQSMGFSYVIESQLTPRSITWNRRTVFTEVEDGTWKQESHTLLQIPVENFVPMVHSYKQERHGKLPGDQISLNVFVESVLSGNVNTAPALVVVEMEKYFRSQKAYSQKKLRQAVLNDGQDVGNKRKKKKAKEDLLPELSRIDVEEALVDLQLHTGVQIRFIETWKEFADYIGMFTKAVAEAPFKRERDKTGFSFYLDNDSSGTKVDRAGKGLLQVWKRQIQQFNRVSPEIANAIASVYASPRLLIKAYNKCSSEQEKQNLLSDILVRRGEGVTSTSKRVGPELSRRIYMQMTFQNPEVCLDI